MANQRKSAQDALRAYRDLRCGIKRLLIDLTGTDETLFNEAEAALREMADVAVPALVDLACDSRKMVDVMRAVGVLMDMGTQAVMALAAGIRCRMQQGKDVTLFNEVWLYRMTYRDPESDRPSMLRIPIVNDAMAAAAAACGLQVQEPCDPGITSAP